MTTYYDDEYRELSEYELHSKFHDYLDYNYPAYHIAEETYYPSEVVKSSGQNSTSYRVMFVNWLDTMIDQHEIYEDEHEFIGDLLDFWLYDVGYTDVWEEVELTDLLFAAQHMYSTGRLELVNGEIQPHPNYSVSDIQSLINYELNEKNNE